MGEENNQTASDNHIRPTKKLADIKNFKGTIGILTGGGDVPGLNPAIAAVTIRAIQEGHKVVGIRNGWEGLINIHRDRKIEEQERITLLDRAAVKKIARSGGTFLHSSRTNPIKVSKDLVPNHLKEQYNQEVNDLTPEVLKNLEYLGIDYMVPIGGDDTLSYGAHLHGQGVKVIAIPKTMDNDVPGTDYCIGFSTCVTRTVEYVHQLRTCAGSHERFLVVEVFGRYAGFSALIPTMAGAADRCVIPEHKFNIDRLTELLLEDKRNHPSNYSVVMVSEGAMFEGGEMVFSDQQVDGFGHKKLGGIGDLISMKLREISPKYNNGQEVQVINQRLGYMVRSGNPDAIDSIVCMAFGNLAMNLIAAGKSGRMVCLRNGRYESVPIGIITSTKKLVEVKKYYNVERYRPCFMNFEDRPMWIMTTD
ncbi:MAG: ATP-dependent 6-phosphofructokinase [Bacteriovoracaceae bacterium]|nr:ATP-dependent 6-phosphofructokinase [Bacteriovoracaceae bacterium]